jgi:ABC-2 type transport system ATP-binding protein
MPLGSIILHFAVRSRGLSLIIEHVSKAFANVQAVSDLSMEVARGSIFGFLGPNGAGKTTTIRMILDLIRPDSGRITWNGQNVQAVPRKSWGYLPEERGLYPKMTVEDQLLFLAQLFGVSRAQALRMLDEWLERFQITSYRHKPVMELSKGNQQKVQVLAALLHDPDILLMDEPLSGLDPINAVQLKEALLELHRCGKTLIFSTHQMQQVEELCQRIVIINKGRIVVEGSVQEIKRRSGRKVVRLALANDPDIAWIEKRVAGVALAKRRQDYVEITLKPDADPNWILQAALQQGATITRFELAEPSLTDIFIELVGDISMPDARSVYLPAPPLAIADIAKTSA